MRFEPKTVKKIGFFGVSRSTLRGFAISQYDSDDAQTHMIATQSDAQGVALIKKGKLMRKKLRFEEAPKPAGARAVQTLNSALATNRARKLGKACS